MFIGQDLDRKRIETQLQKALLTDREMALGAEGWMDFPDPLSPWIEVCEVEGEEHA